MSFALGWYFALQNALQPPRAAQNRFETVCSIDPNGIAVRGTKSRIQCRAFP